LRYRREFDTLAGGHPAWEMAMADLTKTSIRFATLVVVAVMLLAAMAGLAMYKIGATTDRMIEAQEDSRRHLLLLQAIEGAHVHFKSQVQEWKDMLLRAGDAQALQQHRAQFEHESAQVRQLLFVTADSLRAVGLDPQEAEALRTAHADLVDRYRSALDRFDLGKHDAVREIDGVVKGMDRGTSEKFEQVTEDIEVHARQRLDELVRSTKSDADLTWWIFLGAAAAGIGLAILLSLWIVRDLLTLLQSAVIRPPTPVAACAGRGSEGG
jgi:methyl-accepting chemotaxis protein